MFRPCSLITLVAAGLLIGCAAGCSKSEGSNTTPEAAATGLEPGQRELKVHFDYVHARREHLSENYILLCDYLHEGFKNAKVIADENQGLLVFQFDYDVTRWPWPGSFGGVPRTQGAFPDVLQMLFRCADERGRILSSFTTKEHFVGEGGEIPEAFRFAYGDNLSIIRPTNNVLAYPMNARDLQFVQWVEIGFKTARPVRLPE